MPMSETAIHDYARQLWEARGSRAIAEAAQKASRFEAQHNTDEAKTWRNIEAVLKSMRGPRES